ncbi:J domain-containing protein [Pontibacter harenae]|uniref:J domain-containing protein n=1 Tax=Pontibacter harenae TaxID=2894083 RepID=UPI001E33B0C6|nr:J domain-containing protein [Pontibacter harenae]MCC9167169.1 J domain-containing protein [Pontibacter harenae]
MPKEDAIVKGLVPQISAKDKSQLSKLQRQFNNKIDKINKLKQKLVERQKVLDHAQARVQEEIRPLIMQLVDGRVKMVKLLDRSYDKSLFKKRERDKIAMLIEDLSYTLIEAYGVEELIELHDKYADVSYEDAARQAEEESREITEDMLRNVFGLDIELDENSSFDDLQSQMEQQFDEREKEQEKKQSARKKTATQLAKEEKMKAEMENISKASRRVYTELAKMLHPDREKDEAARVWKEEAMKKVTQAYKQDDFFELLRLQMEYMENQDQNLDQLSEQQLKYYLKILNEQAKDLEDEDYEFNFSPDADFYRQYCGTPKQMDQKFGTARNELKKQLTQLKQDIQNFEDPAYLRAFLKEFRFR